MAFLREDKFLRKHDKAHIVKALNGPGDPAVTEVNVANWWWKEQSRRHSTEKRTAGGKRRDGEKRTAGGEGGISDNTKDNRGLLKMYFQVQCRILHSDSMSQKK